MLKEEFIVYVRHIGWVCYQIASGQNYNETLNDDQFKSLLDGVKFALENPDTTPEENHNNWMKCKTEQGWVYGTVKSFKKKTHPDLVAFDELPEMEKRKDIMDSLANKLALTLWDDLNA